MSHVAFKPEYYLGVLLGARYMTMRIVTFKLGEEVLEKLDKYAIRTGRSRSEVIRMAIEEFLERHSYEIAEPPTVYRVRILY